MQKALYGVTSAKDLFGKEVRSLRIERQLSQEKLAGCVQCIGIYIGRVERGK